MPSPDPTDDESTRAPTPAPIAGVGDPWNAGTVPAFQVDPVPQAPSRNAGTVPAFQADPAPLAPPPRPSRGQRYALRLATMLQGQLEDEPKYQVCRTNMRAVFGMPDDDAA